VRQLHRKVDTPLFVPDYLAKNLADIDFQELKKRGIKYIAFDADSTLVNFAGTKLTDDAADFLNKQKPLFKSWVIASNRVINNLDELGASFGADVIRAHGFIRKPNRRFFARVINYFDAPAETIAMVGDKLIADMFGAKRVGMTTIWVEHLGKDNIIDRLNRVRQTEAKLMADYMEKR
jgi:HAD superfamily phosphatase (TIGR01668 family)